MTTCKLVMPGDMNHYGFLFGGKMLMWVDEVAWISVSEDFPTLHFVTVGMSEVKFKKSVHPKSVLRFETRRQATGRTSVTYHVDVFCRQIESRDEEIVFATDITFVCVDDNGVKRPIEPQRAGETGELSRFKPQRAGDTEEGSLVGCRPQRTGEAGEKSRVGFSHKGQEKQENDGRRIKSEV